ADGSWGLQIIDISDPAQPNWVGDYDTPGSAMGVFVSGDYAYVADYYSDLKIIDISDPAQPNWVGYYDTPGQTRGVFISGDYAYVADGFSGLQIIDISDPAQTSWVGGYDTPGYAWGAFVSGHYAYVADRDSGLQIIDISDPAEPSWVGGYDTPGSARGVFVSGDYAYVADEYSLIILRFVQTHVDQPDDIPHRFSLSQNYPNPFNTSTTIQYNLPIASDLTIDIYDILGRKVETLVSLKKPAGSHAIIWDAKDIPSGIYFYKIQAGNYSQSKKCVILK
ncbi:MAG: hypothetical protein B6D58_04115, partial [candidate division Zixibacteria bacterium 4484_95]